MRSADKSDMGIAIFETKSFEIFVRTKNYKMWNFGKVKDPIMDRLCVCALTWV